MARSRKPPFEVAMAADVVLIVVSSFLPWVVSGSATRNLYSAARSAQALDLAGGGVLERALAATYLIPLLASVVVLLVALRRTRAAAIVAIVLGAGTLTLAAAVAISPVEPGYAMWAGGFAAVGAVICGVGVFVPDRFFERDQPLG